MDQLNQQPLDAVLDSSARIEAERTLETAREMADSANARPSRFSADPARFLADDLRQPLQSLGLYLSAMAHQSDTAWQPEIVDKMRQSLDAMDELLDALLDISKLDGGFVVPEKRNVHLQELIDRIVTDNVQQAQEKGLLLESIGDDCVVHSDPVLLERVIENFVTNAIRYTERGRVTIDCQCDDDIVRISVCDTDIGTPDDALDQIFEEYYQLDNNVRDRRKGLGLSIVKYVARLLDHPLRVSSIKGEGSTFLLDVPLGTSVPTRKKPASTTHSRLAGNREPIVLFVDDDPATVPRHQQREQE